MKRHRFLFVIIISIVIFPTFFGVDSGISQSVPPPAARIAKANLQSVVTLVALDDHEQPLCLGSGFFTSANGLVATNAHVIEGAAKVVIRWQGKSGTATRIVRFDPRFDLVILQSSFSATPALKLGDSELATVGEEVIALGNPYGLEGTVSTGIISGLRLMNGAKHLQITAPISPGSSGGPIFNSNGDVIGIATATLSSGQNLNFALSANLINEIHDSNLTFAATKLIPSDNAGTHSYRDLVFADHITEHLSNYHGEDLNSLTLSIQNKTSHTICDLKILIITKNYLGEMLNYYLYDLSQPSFFANYPRCIAAGLAKQFDINVLTKNYNMAIKPSNPWKQNKGSYEIRILDFKIMRGDNTLDNLFKKP
jgi:hypothetical protein